ncbi:DNA-directed RNA polymerase subunit beta' [Candidatus Sumerlaeota bacterium]|nr:DNA-directed RNA polymerase subunit beta' [Candidatus Sumerlaeota bacterium]
MATARMNQTPIGGSILQQLERDSNAEVNLQGMNALSRISIASPAQILNWSRRYCRQIDRRGVCKCGKTGDDIDNCAFGEVKKPETINYRTFKPEKDGLFCERIFGPVKDWECACGKYKRIKYKGIVCDRCGVEVIESKVRRHRMGHIKLAAPVCHIWFYKGTTSRIATLVDVSVRDLQKVIYFQEYIVVDAGDDTPLKTRQLLSEEEARKYIEIYGDKVKIMIGAEAVRELLKKIDIATLSSELAMEMRKATSTQKRTKVIKRLKVVSAFMESNNSPEWMVLSVLPVIPPDLRPLVHLDGGRFATSDLNDLYRRVINRNNRLKRLMELKAPDVILRNEKRMLQEAVDALFDNSRRSRPTKGHNNRPLKSLSDMLKGKQGRFRQNLLGKRVDYSGRSVIVVGPELRFNECGLPKKMALELFDPFIIHELERRGFVNTIKAAKKMMEREEPVVYDILDDIIVGHPVMLNRAPTLHRLGIQAFLPKLVEGKAIRLHPLACKAFNADFDGDQMAVHVPLSTEAKLEAQMIMLAENNILSPSSGKPVATPSQDIVLGLFYLTKMLKDQKGEGMKFSSPQECISAYNQEIVGLHAEVQVRLDGELVKTSPGRIIFSRILPSDVSYFDDNNAFAGEVLTSKIIGQIVHVIHKRHGSKTTAAVLDNMKNLGFEYAKRGGISICVGDMLIPENKSSIIGSARDEALKVVQQWERGVLTAGERYNKIIDIWTHATETMAHEMMSRLKADRHGMNPILIMSVSGARGNEQQIRQLAGMRGLMQKPTKKISGGVGEIIETPIVSNFREGLTVLEYFISTHGARKGLADTALKTSDAGYLTRRLVDVVQDLIITEDDCQTYNGITLTAIKEVTTQGERTLESLGDRLLGRVPVNDVVNPNTGEVICKRNEMITEQLAREIEDSGVEEVLIRSVLTCETRRGICCRCYGQNMATGRMVQLGESVGVVAAQSIGEPGTQLTLRTFHIGGTASVLLEGWYQSNSDGYVKLKGVKYIERKNEQTGQKELIVINRTGNVHVQDENGTTVQVLPNIPYGSTIMRMENDAVREGDVFIRWSPQVMPILAEVSGTVKFHDIVSGITLREEVDPATEAVQKLISEHREELHPQIHIVDENGDVISQHTLSAGTILSPGLADGSQVIAGDVLARIPRTVTKSRDITGGLPRVDELFEARKPKDQALIADIDGIVQFRGISKGARKIAVVAENGEEDLYTVPHARHILVRDGERVRAGDQLTDGSISPHDILRVKGEKAVQEFLLQEIQKVYRLQGVSINDKHIEAIIRQMLKKVVIEEVGNTSFLYGQQVDRFAFQEENESAISKGGEPARAKPKLLGLTKASLETDSFISAASFQETTRVLTDAAVRGRVDHLRGLKENVIMGLLIPAGTGLPIHHNIEVGVAGEERSVEEELEEETQPDKAIVTSKPSHSFADVELDDEDENEPEDMDDDDDMETEDDEE